MFTRCLYFDSPHVLVQNATQLVKILSDTTQQNVYSSTLVFLYYIAVFLLRCSDVLVSCNFIFSYFSPLCFFVKLIV